MNIYYFVGHSFHIQDLHIMVYIYPIIIYLYMYLFVIMVNISGYKWSKYTDLKVKRLHERDIETLKTWQPLGKPQFVTEEQSYFWEFDNNLNSQKPQVLPLLVSFI